MFLRPLAAAMFGLALATPPAFAQQTVPNPLRPKVEDGRPTPTERAKPAERAGTEQPAERARPQRERSAKQRQNDEMMKACGAEWRAEKASLQAKGETWRSFLKDCRGRKKAEVPA